jgi:hypothetical protein
MTLHAAQLGFHRDAAKSRAVIPIFSKEIAVRWLALVWVTCVVIASLLRSLAVTQERKAADMRGSEETSSACVPRWMRMDVYGRLWLSSCVAATLTRTS